MVGKASGAIAYKLQMRGIAKAYFSLPAKEAVILKPFNGPPVNTKAKLYMQLLAQQTMYRHTCVQILKVF
jgi:hypothetical protein